VQPFAAHSFDASCDGQYRIPKTLPLKGGIDASFLVALAAEVLAEGLEIRDATCCA
jgi:hypothetical protein